MTSTYVNPTRSLLLAYLPNDVLLEIFLCVDWITLGRCKVLSKQWNMVLSSVVFSESCFHHLKAEEVNILVQLEHAPPPYTNEFFTMISAAGGASYRVEVPFKVNSVRWFYMIGVGNGVICFRFFEQGNGIYLMLWNPVMRIVRAVEDLLDYEKWGCIGHITFGYIPGSFEYVLLNVFKRNALEQQHWFMKYSSLTMEWTPAEPVKNLRSMNLASHSIFHRGTTYWTCCNDQVTMKPNSILRADLDSCSFTELLIPVPSQGSYGMIVVHDNEVCFINLTYARTAYTVQSWKIKWTNNTVPFLWDMYYCIPAMSVREYPTMMLDSEMLTVMDYKAQYVGSANPHMTPFFS